MPDPTRIDIFTRPSGLVIRRVSGSVFRSAQPVKPEDWQFIQDTLGVTSVVKLNTEQEGSEIGARALGLDVYELGIEPYTVGGVVQKIEGVFKRPDLSMVEQALELMAAGECLVHCEAGHDRTGLCCALYRVRYDGWSTEQAWKEALDLGYHPELVGLGAAWFEENAAGRTP
jgi:hypothetical protein